MVLRNGKWWTITVKSQEEAWETDRDDWRQMTPDERVAAVADCTLSALKARGYSELPRLQKVVRILDAPWRKEEP